LRLRGQRLAIRIERAGATTPPPRDVVVAIIAHRLGDTCVPDKDAVMGALTGRVRPIAFVGAAPARGQSVSLAACPLQQTRDGLEVPTQARRLGCAFAGRSRLQRPVRSAS
jgi:hypothetical protein